MVKEISKKNTFNLFTLLIIVVVPIIIVVVPILINWIIGLHTPCKIIVVGESKDWLSFYGSYIGGIITALISFFILYRTIRHNKNEAEITRKKQDLEILENRLSEHIAFLNFYKIETIALVINDDALSQAEILKLEAFNYDLIRKSNSLHLIYDGKSEKHIVDYLGKFDACIKQMNKDIDEMTRLIFELVNAGKEMDPTIKIDK